MWNERKIINDGRALIRIRVITYEPIKERTI